MHALPLSFRSALARALALFALGILAGPPRSPAVEIYFTNNASGTLDPLTPGYWAPNTVPGLNATALFTNPAANQIFTLGANWNVANVDIDTGNSSYKTFNLGNGRVWTVTNEFLIGTNAATTGAHKLTTGTLAITNGAKTATLHLVNSGIFQLSGGLLLADRLQVDSSLNSRLLLNAGALEFVGGKTNTVDKRITLGGGDPGSTMTIQGANTILKVYEAQSNVATNRLFVVKDKATVIMDLGWQVAANGQRVIIDGARVDTGYLQLGISTTNAPYNPQLLVVSNGGQLFVRSTFATGGVTNGVGANSIFTGTGTLVSVSSGVNVGNTALDKYSKNASSIFITDGATMEFKSGSLLVLGEEAGFTNRGGVLRFIGAIPTISNAFTSTVKVEMADGTMEIQDLANADLTGALAAKVNYSGMNTLSLTNAKNANVTTYTFGSGQNFAVLDLKDAASTFRSSQSLLIDSGGTLKGSGTLEAGVVTNKGTIAPGHSPGTLTFSNNLVLDATSLLVLEIAGTNAGAYDRLVGGGTLTAGGTLTITNLGWTFAAGDTFDFFDFPTISTNFAAFNLPTLDAGLAWDFSQFQQGILVVAVPEPTALMAMGAGLAFLFVLRRRREG